MYSYITSISPYMHLKGNKRQGKTPLHYAARYGRLEMCEFLKEQFGKVKSNDGTTVVMMACFGGSVECAEVRTVVRDERQYCFILRLR